MTEQHEDFDSIHREQPSQLSAEELQAGRFQPRLYKNIIRPPLRNQVSKPPRNAVQIRPAVISTHFKWALILTILCFFTIGPCWALYKSFKLRQMIQRQELDAAYRLSHRIATVLVVSAIIGIFVWVAILFCSVGLVLAGKLLVSNVV